MIKIEMDDGWGKLARLLKDIEKRYQAYLSGIAIDAARVGKSLLKGRSPTDTEMGMRYKSGFQIVGVKMQNLKAEELWSGPAYTKRIKDEKGEEARSAAIVYWAKREEVRDRDPEKTLFHFKPKANKKHKHPGLYIMMKYNPWTADTLPWIPPKGDTVITYTVEKESVVSAIRKKRKRDLPRVVNLLKKKGVKLKPDKKPKNIESASVMSDLCKMALSFEFGLGRRSKPHWKPMVRYFRKQGIEKIANTQKFLRTMTDPNYNGWKRLGVVKIKIAVKDVENFDEFQQRIS